MQKYDPKLTYIGTGEYISEMVPSDSGEFYLASDVDAHIAELMEIIHKLERNDDNLAHPAARGGPTCKLSRTKGHI